MTLREPVNPHSPKRDRLLRDFESIFRKARPLLVTRFDKTAAVEISDETRREYEALMPRIPCARAWVIRVKAILPGCLRRVLAEF